MVLRFFSRAPWDIHAVAPPWGERPSIARHVGERLRSSATSLSRAGGELPDESLVAGAAGFSWAPGAWDGAFGHHAGGDSADEIAIAVVTALSALTKKATDRHAASLYSLLTAHSALEYVDQLLQRLTGHTTLPADRLHAVARWLAAGAADREPVKAAIAILGAISRDADRELLLTLGRHEEFTLFAAVAIQHSVDQPEPVLWDLAQHVTGWGRVHLVERLASTADERIKAWLLRDGCRNDIMDEYTALVCARSGDLIGALGVPDPDAALIKGAGAILAALIRGGPAEGIEAYGDGPEALQRYVHHLRGQSADLEDLNVLATIEPFVEAERAKAGDEAALWRERAPAIAEHIHAINARPDWPARIHQGLESDDPAVFWAAANVARRFGIDTWEVYFERLQRGENQWYFVMQTDDPARIDRVVQLAEQRLPLGDIASGPARELGMGPAFQAHGALDFVLQDVRRFPGKGWRLIQAGLRSPVTRNRNMAVRALGAWDRAAWPAEAEHLLRRAMKAEPEGDTRENMRKVLDGEPLDF